MKPVKLLKYAIVTLCFCFGVLAFAQSGNGQSEIEQITETLTNYIDGSANGEVERLRSAFHPDANLYSVAEADTLKTWDSQDYFTRFEEGRKNNRIGRIVAIDFEKDAATAKVEILIPGYRLFTDYFLLLKLEGAWKIVHKSYTWREIPKTETE